MNITRETAIASAMSQFGMNRANAQNLISSRWPHTDYMAEIGEAIRARTERGRTPQSNNFFAPEKAEARRILTNRKVTNE